MSGALSTQTSVALMNVRAGPFVLTLPLTTSIPYRVLYMKDIYGAVSATSTITLKTQGADIFEDGTTTKVFKNPYEITSLLAGQPGYWYTIGGTTTYQQTMSNLNASTIHISSINFADTVTGSQNLLTVTNGFLQLNGYSIVGTGWVTSTNLTSTVIGLGTTGYLSTSQLTSTVAGLGTAGYLSSINLSNLVSTGNFAGLVSTANLANLVSTANLVNLVSTANFANLVSTSYLATQFGSTV